MFEKNPANDHNIENDALLQENSEAILKGMKDEANVVINTKVDIET